MKSTGLFPFALSLFALVGISNAQGCGTVTDSNIPRRAALSVTSTRADLRRDVSNTTTNATTPIDTYLHVLQADETIGHVSDDLITEQMGMLVDAFVPTGFGFNLIEVVRTINESWQVNVLYYNATQESQEEIDMKNALRRGDNQTLNIYLAAWADLNITAWSTLPWEIAPYFPGSLQYDGVVIHQETLPGGNAPFNWNKGKTMIHEVGHWVGLRHPFDGDVFCNFDLDYVADTPIELEPKLGSCVEGLDSCPDQPGLDNIHNYMDYTSDDCRYLFTPGQIEFLQDQMSEFRGMTAGGLAA